MAIIPNSQKTFSVNEGVNTVYGGSASMKALSQWYTMQDITDTVRPYQVYTALITQSGGENLQPKSNGLLTIGVTYWINDNIGNPDFTNVGAPNNDTGTYFVATGTTPNSWGDVGDATVLKYNTGAPVVTVLENTIGNVWFSFSDNGIYNVVSNNLFTENKTYSLIGGYSYNIDGVSSVRNSIYFSGIESLVIMVQTVSEDEGTFNNGHLINTPIEIRVYN